MEKKAPMRMSWKVGLVIAVVLIALALPFGMMIYGGGKAAKNPGEMTELKRSLEEVVSQLDPKVLEHEIKISAADPAERSKEIAREAERLKGQVISELPTDAGRILRVSIPSGRAKAFRTWIDDGTSAAVSDTSAGAGEEYFRVEILPVDIGVTR